jgi:hypothetical protein
MEGEGLPHEDAHWNEDRIEADEAMVAARRQDRGGVEIAHALRRASMVTMFRRYEKRAEGWTWFAGEEAPNRDCELANCGSRLVPAHL